MTALRKTIWLPIIAGIVVITVSFVSFGPSQSISFLIPGPATIRPADTRESENRLLTADECVRRYPDLYLEADRAKAWYASRGGITAEAVDLAEKEGGNARMAIIDNRVCRGQ